MQQDIRFCTSADGVKIASTSTGSGTPLVRAGTWLSHLECDARHQEPQANIRALSPPQLTPRQTEVLQAVARGLTDKQIAKAMDLSPRTVEMHVSGSMKALGCTTRAEAVHRAGALGFLQA